MILQDFQEKKNELKSYTADEDSAFSLTTKKKKTKKKNTGEETSVEQGELVSPRISLEEPTPRRYNKKINSKKKGKTKEFANSPDPNILDSNNLMNGKVPKRTNNKKHAFNDNYADFQSSPVINITSVDDAKKTKKPAKKIYHDEIDCSGSLDQSTLVELPKFKPNKNDCKNDLDYKDSVQERPKEGSTFNASRADLFLARSSSESLRNIPSVKEKKKAKKGEIDTSLQFKKKKRKKTSRTAPLSCSSPNNAQEQPELLELRKNGHASKLEPIKLKGSKRFYL